MKITSGLIGALAGASLLGGVGVAALASSASAATTTATVLTVAPSPVATPAPGTPDDASCKMVHDGGWPSFATGEPTGFGAGSPAGVYLWHDDGGWHLRVTHAHDTHQVYTATISTPGTFFDVDAVRLEKNDSVHVGPDGHVITYTFNNYGGVDGIDFRTDCAPRISFDLRADGRELPTSAVRIGVASTNPTSVPFEIERSY